MRDMVAPVVGHNVMSVSSWLMVRGFHPLRTIASGAVYFGAQSRLSPWVADSGDWLRVAGADPRRFPSMCKRSRQIARAFAMPAHQPAHSPSSLAAATSTNAPSGQFSRHPSHRCGRWVSLLRVAAAARLEGRRSLGPPQHPRARQTVFLTPRNSGRQNQAQEDSNLADPSRSYSAPRPRVHALGC